MTKILFSDKLDNCVERWKSAGLTVIGPVQRANISTYAAIEHADRIVVLEQGKIIENGSHEDLIKKDGLYANLHRIQFSNA